MLYKLSENLDGLEPMPFCGFSKFQRREKHLEEVLSGHLFETLFEGLPLMPFHQERSFQPEGDIYALSRTGDIVIFELKVSTAADDALDQLLRYAQGAGQWTYEDIDRKFRAYPKQAFGNKPLAEAHQNAFDLEMPLAKEAFNSDQQMIVIGSAADTKLVQGVDYWKRKGLAIDFCPYRIFEIGGQPYFEFFAKPYDDHTNPAERKGVLFDTCRTYYQDGLKWMIEKRRISAFGDRKNAVESLAKNDLVFYSHGGVGLVAAARIIGSRIRQDQAFGDDELYWDVQFETPVPTQFDAFPNAMPFDQVKSVTGKSFFWARIQKVPYLDATEAEHLLAELKICLAGNPQAVPTV